MNAEQTLEYISGGGVLCPYCKSDKLLTEPFECDLGIAWQAISCSVCGEEWRDCYNLVDVTDND